jgi:hypothetical protein
MVHRLMAMDAKCGKIVLDAWKEMVSTIRENISSTFVTLDEYLEFRMVDAGSP